MDPGVPNQVHLQEGFESPVHLVEIEKALWPRVVERLPLLDASSLAALVPLCEAWVRVARGFEGAGGATPPAASRAIAERFASTVLRALVKESVGKPGLEVRLRRTMGLLGVGLRSRLDPEFRVLAWGWDVVGRRNSRHIFCAARRLADRWATEPPAELAVRIVLLRRQATEVGIDFYPMIDTVMREFAKRTPDIDAMIDAGLRAGLTHELLELMRASLLRPHAVPAWIASSLLGQARPAAVSAALTVGSNADAAWVVVAVLDDRDVLNVENAIISRRAQQDEVSRALLRHPVGSVRGTASLWFAIDPSDHVPALPPAWYPDWRTAFRDAPVLSNRGADNHRLGQQLRHLVARDPDLVEQWLIINLDADFSQTVLHLPRAAEARLADLPRPNRDRLMRRFWPHIGSYFLLALLIGDDGAFVGNLLDDGIVTRDHVLAALGNVHHDDEGRISTLIRLAPSLLSRGVSPEALAANAVFGTRFGEESSHYEALRAAFEKIPPCTDTDQEAVRQAGLRLFSKKRDIALAEEARKLIDGDL